MFKSEKRDGAHIFIFDNINQLVRFNSTTTLNRDVFDTISSDRHTSEDNDFYGDICNYKAAETMLVNGWEEGYQRAIRELGKLQIENPNQERKFDREIAVEGYAPCVPRLLEGHPETMHNHKIIKIRKKIVTIVVQNGNIGDVSADRILRRGMIITNYINGLEKLGFRVNLYGGACASEHSEYCLSMYKLKDSKENVSIKRLVFPLAHPSMHRRINFRTRECMHECNEDWGWGYGRTEDHTFKEFIENKFESAMFIPSIRTINCTSGTKADVFMKEVYSYNKNFRVM